MSKETMIHEWALEKVYGADDGSILHHFQGGCEYDGFRIEHPLPSIVSSRPAQQMKNPTVSNEHDFKLYDGGGDHRKADVTCGI